MPEKAEWLSAWRTNDFTETIYTVSRSLTWGEIRDVDVGSYLDHEFAL